jgi:hypothetical protein
MPKYIKLFFQLYASIEIFLWKKKQDKNNKKYEETCCQWVGESSGAVESTTAASRFASVPIGPLNSTSNQNPNPWRGAKEVK